MMYCVNTKEVGIKIKTDREWDREKRHKFKIEGLGDSLSRQCPDTKKSVTGTTTTLEGAPVITRLQMQSTVKLSITESEIDSTVTTVQNMLL